MPKQRGARKVSKAEMVKFIRSACYDCGYVCGTEYGLTNCVGDDAAKCNEARKAILALIKEA
jgi:hypothetical protein